MKTLAFFFALMVPVFGRLGETETECSVRYGPNQSTSGGLGTYQKNNINIYITFTHGVAERIRFTRLSDKILGEALTDEQIKDLLKANQGLAKGWLSIQKTSSGEDFVRKDGTAYATWNFSSGTLEIISQQERKREDDERSAKRAADLAEQKARDEALKKSTEGF